MDASQLEAIVAEAKADEAATPKPGDTAGTPAAPIADPVKEAEDLFGIVVAVVSAIEPTAAVLYPPERIRLIAERYVPVAEKHGWDLAAWLGKWAPELMLAAALIPPPLARAIFAGIKAKLAKKKPADPAPTEAAATPPATEPAAPAAA